MIWKGGKGEGERGKGDRAHTHTHIHISGRASHLAQGVGVCVEGARGQKERAGLSLGLQIQSFFPLGIGKGERRLCVGVGFPLSFFLSWVPHSWRKRERDHHQSRNVWVNEGGGAFGQ